MNLLWWAGKVLLFFVFKIVDVDPPTQYQEKTQEDKVGKRHLDREAWHAHVWSRSNYHEYGDSDDEEVTYLSADFTRLFLGRGHVSVLL